MSDKPQSQQDPDFIRGTFSSIAGRYDFANHALSGGADFLWRDLAARIVRSWAPRVILDLATGSGDLALVLAKKNPTASVVAADFCEPMLRVAQRKAVPNLIAADGTKLPFATGAFDALTVAFGLRNMATYDGALAEMARVLRPGGHVLVLDFSLPSSPLLRSGYRFYLHRMLPTLAGFATGRPEAYAYLGESIEAFPRGQAMLSRIEGAGFTLAEARPLWCGIVTIYTATRCASSAGC